MQRQQFRLPQNRQGSSNDKNIQSFQRYQQNLQHQAPPCFYEDYPSDMLNPDDMMSKPPTLPRSSMATGKQGGIVGTGLFKG